MAMLAPAPSPGCAPGDLTSEQQPRAPSEVRANNHPGPPGWWAWVWALALALLPFPRPSRCALCHTLPYPLACPAIPTPRRRQQQQQRQQLQLQRSSRLVSSPPRVPVDASRARKSPCLSPHLARSTPPSPVPRCWFHRIAPRPQALFQKTLPSYGPSNDRPDGSAIGACRRVLLEPHALL